MPNISINITNMLTFSAKTGWQRPRILTDVVFGYNEALGCRAMAYRFVCPQFFGNAKKVLVSVPVRIPANELVTQNFNISVTDTLPTMTSAYNTRVLGEDAGRVGTISAVITGAGVVQELFEVPVTSLKPGSDYFIILSANEESAAVSYTNTADCSMYYHPRPSTISIPPKARNYLGDEIIISINRYSADVSHRITYNFVNSNGVILDNYSEPDSVAWTPPMSLAYEVPKAMSGMCELVCETTVDDEVIGTNVISFRLYFPPVKFVPNVSSITVAPVSDNSVVSGWKTYVQGYSKVRVVVAASALYGATVANCEVRVGSQESVAGFSVTSDVLYDRGAIPIYATVTDSRGQQSTASTQVYVYPYAKPSLSGIICHRADGTGAYNADGTHYFVQATARYSSVAGKNSYAIEAQYKTVDGEYGEAVLLASGSGSILGEDLSPYRTYVVKIVIRDALNAIPYTIPIPEERNTFKIKDGGRGVGIGAIPTEDDLLDVGFDARFQKTIRVDNDGNPVLFFMVNGQPVGAIGSKSTKDQFGEMFIRIYNADGSYQEHTWLSDGSTSITGGIGLPMPPTASVGQFITVAAIDELGAVTATEAVTLEHAEEVAFG